ncbi:MAG: IS481 family transposase [Gammaproteobacteria bacterium]|nr:IS481 family transposase [Gammaproteobacteria bacterium]
MPWKEETTMSQKLHFIKSYSEESISFTQLCMNFKISRKTGYNILKRYEEHGCQGLQPQSRSPHHSPEKTSPRMEKKIIEVRVKHPTWGPRKIKTALANKNVNDLPSISTISAILKRCGYISLEESSKRKKLIRFEREFSNDLWQMDFKGKFQLQTKEACYPLTILDDYSRFSLDIRSCANERHDTVFQHLIRVFKEYGLPNQFNVDNGNPWGNSQLVQHTKLTVWLMRLGIKVTHSRPKHPQTNGKIERFHRTLKKDVISRNKITSFIHAQKLFDKWREIYNHERPHEALGMLVPAKRYQPSTIAMPKKLAPIEYGEGAILHKVRGNGYINYRNNEYLVGRGFDGLFVQIKPAEASNLIKIYFGNNKIQTYHTD